MMTLAASFLARQRTAFGAYVALQRALMQHHIARGGTAEDFCRRLAPVFRLRYGALLLEGGETGETRSQSHGRRAA
jgi:hypothetical protein